MKEKFLKYKLNNMSLSDKISQMFIIDYRNTFDMNNGLESILSKYNVGGFILFKSNINNFNQSYKLINDIKNIGSISPFICVDQEGGRVQRLGKNVGFEIYPSMFEVGSKDCSEYSFELGIKMGKELKSIGIDMNMAPVLDIFSNVNNKVISDRSFGSCYDIVNRNAFSFADGLRKQGIIAIGKHFPGHGDTFVDSHCDLPIVCKSLDELKKLELIPFYEAVKKKMAGLMVGHIIITNVSNDFIPASLSKKIISDLLINKMGYNGLILSDSLKMKSLFKYFSYDDIYCLCVLAGNDLLLMPHDIDAAFDITYTAVNDGKIFEDRIDNSVYKILSLKFDYGFFDDEYNKFLNYRKDNLKIKQLKID